MYELYYEKEAISKQLYEWLLKNGYADAMLIAKWKKTGYEKVCCSQISVWFCLWVKNYADFGVIVMLPALRTNERNELQLYMYMPGS